jgi:hypothetical protein
MQMMCYEMKKLWTFSELSDTTSSLQQSVNRFQFKTEMCQQFGLVIDKEIPTVISIDINNKRLK